MKSETWYWEETWGRTRKGSLDVRVVWEGGEGIASLYEVGVPLTVKEFRSKLPLQINMIHVAWSGGMLMGAEQVDLDIELKENYTRLPRIGDICYDPNYKELTITYDAAEARLPSGENTLTVIGGIKTNLEEFARWARARRFLGQGELAIMELV